ncbi:MAG: hypothetical protein QXS74_09365 [Nitrososphaeria archaeon]
MRSGLNIHCGFGLRKKWLEEYFSHSESFSQLLGNKQFSSLKSWLKTLGIEGQNKDSKELLSNIRFLGLKNLATWEIFWINIVFNFRPAKCYVFKTYDEIWTNRAYTTSQLRDLLLSYYPMKSPRTISNAILELVGTLEYTPIGDKLRQGKVLRKGRAREVIREGYKPSAIGLNYSLMKLFNQQDTSSLDLNDERLLWPWIIFGCKKHDLLPEIVLSSKYYDLDGHIISLTKLAREEMPKWLNGSILISSI